MTITDLKTINPAYVQIGRKEAAAILGKSPTEFDRMRKSDPECPGGFTNGKGRTARVLFRLSDIYTYSEHLMQTAQPAPAVRQA